MAMETLNNQTNCKVPKLINNTCLIKEEIDLTYDDSDGQGGMINELPIFPNEKRINLRDVRIQKFQTSSQQNQLLNSSQGTSNLPMKIAPNNSKVLINGKKIGFNLNICKQVINYPCDKCSFVTWNKSLLTQHIESVHAPKECPKCALICENEKSFLFHYEQSCKSINDIYECKVCKYQCQKISLLSLHFKLVHSVPKVVKNGENSFSQKQTVDLIHHNSYQNITPNSNKPKIIMFIPIKSLNLKDDSNFATQKNTTKSLSLTGQRNSVKRNNDVNFLFSTHSDNSVEIVEEDCFKAEKMIAKTETVGFYYCLKCDFKSQLKIVTRQHCEENHPEISDPLGLNNESEFIEYRVLENNKQETKNLAINHSVDLNSHSTLCRKTQQYSKRIKQRMGTNEALTEETVVCEATNCENCGTKFLDSISLERHLTVCMNSQTCSCDDCSLITRTKIGLQRQIMQYHLNASDNDIYMSKPPYGPLRKINQYIQCYCMACSKRYAINYYAKKCPKCKNSLMFRCQFCENTFESNDAKACDHVKAFLMKLDVERSNLLKKGTFQCSDCSFQVARSRLAYLKDHIWRFHARNRNKSCKKCNWDFESNSGLLKHIAYCGKKINMQCKVILTRVKAEPADLPASIKQEVVF